MKSGLECTETIEKLTSLAEELLADDEESGRFRLLFGAEELNDGEFLFMFADIFVELV